MRHAATVTDTPTPALARGSDKELLHRFVRKRDQAAFRALVERYGPMVLAVCRRNTYSTEDAEDAFQAAFLVLSQSAGKIRRQRSLSAWLYGVAVRVSARTRRSSSKPPGAAIGVEEIMDTHDPLDELLARHDGMIADEELSALPENLRTPMVLRYLAGKSNQETADELGISIAALEGRLKRAKSRLRGRLLRRGVTLAVVVAVLKSSRVSAGALPAELADATATLATTAGAAGSIPQTTSPSITQAATLELNAMNALMLPKALLPIGTAVALTLALGVHLANSQGIAPSGDSLPLQSDVDNNQQRSGDNSAVTAGFTASLQDTVSLLASGDQPTPNVLRAQLPRTAQVVTSLPSVVDTKRRTALDRKIELALADKMASRTDFSDTPLGEVADYLRDQVGVPIVFDQPGLDELGISTDEPITVELPATLRFESALRHILGPLELEAIIKDEVLWITTQEQAATLLETRVYPLSGVRIAPELLRGLIVKSVEPESWNAEAVIESSPSGLVIRQTFAAHREIADLLKQLQSSIGQANVGIAPPNNPAPPAQSTSLLGGRGRAERGSELIATRPANAVVAAAAPTEYEPWTKQDLSVLQALMMEYDKTTESLHRKRAELNALAEEEAAAAPQNATKNELDKQQLTRLQQELLEVRRLEATSAGSKPVQEYREQLGKEIAELTQSMLARTRSDSNIDSRLDEITQLERELEKLADGIAQLKRKQVIGRAIQHAPKK